MDLRLLFDILALSAVGLVGVFAVIGHFNKTQKQFEQDADATEAKVISLLKDQVAALETKVEQQAVLLDETTKKLDMLVSENRTLKDVLQGRDKDFIDYQKQGREAMKQGQEIHIMVKEIRETINKLASGQINVTVQK